jgi:ankyrin repeat protein
MSVPSNPEFLRKQAKSLLKQVRAGDMQAIRRVRAHLPRLAALPDSKIPEVVKLSDVQHALARELGHANWGELKREDSLIDQFLVAVRGGALRDAQRLFTSLPEMAAESIHAACAIGDPDAVAHHLDQSPALLSTEHGGWTPLFYACGTPFNRVTARQSAGILECAQLLLDRGADPNSFVLTNSSDPESELSAARRAMMSANMPVVGLLMSRGAKPNFKKWVANYDAKAGGHSEILGDLFGKTDFRDRMQQRIQEMGVNKEEATWGPDKWWFHSPGKIEPPMMNPVFYKPMLERQLLDPNKPSFNGFAPLQLAARNGTPAVIELFLDHGADIHAVSPEGRTALVHAVRAGKTLNAKALYARGATSAGLRPIDALVGACLVGNAAETRKILQEHPRVLHQATTEDSEMLVHAAGMNVLDQVRLMLGCGFDPGSFGEGGMTALHAAAWHGNVEMVRMLLEFHAPVNVRDTTYRNTPLAWAAHGSKHKKNAEEAFGEIRTALVEAGGV